MRNMLIAAAALAVGGFIATGPALAQQSAPMYQPGGPDQIGGWCKVVTSPKQVRLCAGRFCAKPLAGEERHHDE